MLWEWLIKVEEIWDTFVMSILESVPLVIVQRKPLEISVVEFLLFILDTASIACSSFRPLIPRTQAHWLVVSSAAADPQ